ncbi:2392_t:CDS:1, partial [Dentiscutata heterogama]
HDSLPQTPCVPNKHLITLYPEFSRPPTGRCDLPNYWLPIERDSLPQTRLSFLQNHR